MPFDSENVAQPVPALVYCAHQNMRSGVEKLAASPAPSLPPVVPLRVPSPRSNRGVPVAFTCVRITGQEKPALFDIIARPSL